MNPRYKRAAAVLGAAALLAAALPALAADPPTVTITSGPADNSIVSTSSVSFEFVAANASSTNCTLSGAGSPGDPYACSSPQNFVLPDGSYAFMVEAEAGTSTANAQRVFTIDTDQGTTTDDEEPITAPPTTTITSGPDEGGTVSGETVTFEFSVMHASSTMCALAGIDATSTSPYECSSPQSFTLSEGSYRFSVEAGNPLGTSSVSRTFTMDASSVSNDGDGGGGGGSRGGGGFRRYPTPVVVTGAVIAGEGTGGGNIGGAGDLSDFPLVITPLAPAITGSGAGGTGAGAGTGGRVAVTPASAQVGGVVQTDENITAPAAPTTTAATTASAIGTSSATGTLGAAAAAAAGSAATIPGWAWFVLAVVLLGALLYWAYRSSVGYDTRR